MEPNTGTQSSSGGDAGSNTASNSGERRTRFSIPLNRPDSSSVSSSAHPRPDFESPARVQSELAQPERARSHRARFDEAAASDDIDHPALEGVEYDDSPDDKKDLSLRLSLALVAILTIIGGFAFYAHKYAQPETGRVSLFDSIFMQSSASNDDAGLLGGASDILVSQKQDMLNQQESDQEAALNASTSASTTSMSVNGKGGNMSAITLQSDTFAPVSGTSGKSDSSKSSAANNIITEYVIRATSTAAASAGTTTRVDVLSDRYVSEDLGISFLIDPHWSISSRANSSAAMQSGAAASVIYIRKVGSRESNTITIQRFVGVSVTTEDSALGNVTYYYDAQAGQWMKIDYSDSTSTSAVIHPESFPASKLTVDKKPIFEGTTAIKTSIIALGTKNFIIINIKGSGSFTAFDSFVKSIRE